MESSRLPLTKWGLVMFFMTTELKGKSSMKLPRDLGITQKSAWFMEHRIRSAYMKMVGMKMVGAVVEDGKFTGKTEFDETAVSGKAKSMSEQTKANFRKRGGGTGFGGKEIVAEAKNREAGKVVVKRIDKRGKETLQGFVEGVTEKGSMILTDEATGYKGMEDREHKTVNRSAKRFVDGTAHVAGMESFWSLFKRRIDGMHHKVSPKHVELYAFEYAGRHNDRPEDAWEQMRLLAKGTCGVRLTYKNLTADNGRSNFARPVRVGRVSIKVGGKLINLRWPV